MSKFTPGPWEVIDDVRVYGKDGLICKCNVPLDNDPSDDEWDNPEVVAALDEVAANARLIAAAPDLLAALKEIVRYDAADEPASHEFMPLDSCPSCIARAAIDKCR